MKRFTFVAVALCLAFVMAVPAMAVDPVITGTYRARGFVNQDATTRSTAATDAYMDMRLRVKTVFNITDDLRLTTRFDALEKQWGASDTVSTTTTNAQTTATTTTGHTHTATSTNSNQQNVDWERAYMTFVTGLGKFDVGRMAGGTFGTSFANTDSSYDRIKFTTVFGPLTLLAIFQKSGEADAGTTLADQDYDVYYLAPIFKAENFTAGILYGYYINKSNSDLTTVANRYDTKFHLFDPYITAKFGNLRFQAEAQLLTGDERDFTDAGGATDIDKDELAYNIEVGFNFGAFSVEAGYAFFSGDQNLNTDNEDSAHSGFGNDWEKLFILAGDTGSISGILGTSPAAGNLSSTGVAVSTANDGAKMIYLGGSFAVSDQLKLGVMLGYAEADEVPATWKDEYGTEIDLKLTYKIMDNLTYSAVVAYLDAGDYWYGATSGVAPTNFEDVTAWYHKLQVSF